MTACWASPQALESCRELTLSLAKRDCLTRAGPSEPVGLRGDRAVSPGLSMASDSENLLP